MGNMKANRKFKEEEAVSAVIGVILMVAITVAIAATVYVYVSGITGGTTKTAPAVTFRITDAADSAVGGTYAAAGDDVFNFEHAGGDKLTMKDLKIQYKSSAVTSWTTIDATGVANGLKATIPTYLEVGDTIVLEAVTAAGTPSGDYTFRVIHTPSNSIILSETPYTAE